MSLRRPDRTPCDPASLQLDTFTSSTSYRTLRMSLTRTLALFSRTCGNTCFWGPSCVLPWLQSTVRGRRQALTFQFAYLVRTNIDNEEIRTLSI